jgi:hypothetical protein
MTLVIRDIFPIECSFVNLPADQNEERAAQIVSVGESLEFYASTETGVSSGVVETSEFNSEGFALALQESWNDFLQQVQPQTEVTPPKETMDQIDTQESQAIVSEEEITETPVEESTNETPTTEDDQTPVVNTTLESGSTDDTGDTSDDVTASESVGDLLDAHFSEEAEVPSEEIIEEEIVVDATLQEANENLTTRVGELEAENARLQDQLEAQEGDSARITRGLQRLVAESVLDLQLALSQVEETDRETVASTLLATPLAELLTTRKTLREEFLAAPIGLAAVMTTQGIIANQTLGSEDVPSGTESTETQERFISNEELVENMSNLFRPRKNRKAIGV